MYCVLKVSFSSFLKIHQGSARPGPLHPPQHLLCLPKSATPSACTWTTSCEQTECEPPTSWRTRTSRPVRRCATTGDSYTCRRTSIGRSLRPRSGRKSQTWLCRCSPFLIRAFCETSEFLKFKDAHTHSQSVNACRQRNMKGYTLSLKGNWHWCGIMSAPSLFICHLGMAVSSHSQEPVTL